MNDVHVQGGWVLNHPAWTPTETPETDQTVNAHIHGLRHLVLGHENRAVIVHGVTVKGGN